MKYNPEKHHRRSIRLKRYDYSQPGWYFVTIVAMYRECLFGGVENGNMVLNAVGKFVQKCWLDIPSHFSNVKVDEFIVMPNHIHGIISIIDDEIVGVQNFEPLQQPHQDKPLQQAHQNESLQRSHQNKYQKIIHRSIGSIIRGFKIGVTKWFRNNTDIHNVWHRNYYDHIIRDENELNRIREYIVNNPLKWDLDNENPNNAT